MVAIGDGHSEVGAAATGSHRSIAILIFLAVLVAGLLSVTRYRQLGTLGGITDEYFALGAKLRVNGTLGIAENEPSALRAPLYPSFIAAALWMSLPPPRELGFDEFNRAGRLAVAAAQTIVLAATAAALYLWLSAHIRRQVAAVIGLAFGLNPYCLVLVGLLHYSILHTCCLVLAAWGLDRALEGRRFGHLLLAGIAWGVSNLVRQITLLLPVFLLGMLLLRRRSWKAAVRDTSLVALGMALALLPWTLRNFRVTGRVIPVTDNGWVTLWGQTARNLPADPFHYTWYELYLHDMMPIFARVTGESAYDYVAQNRRSAELEHAFKEEALRNIRSQPLVYVSNAIQTFRSFNLEVNAVLLAAFRHVQTSAEPMPHGDWFKRGTMVDLGNKGLVRGFSAFILCVTALASVGAVLAIAQRAAWLGVAAAVHLCIATTHALLFMHFMHYYAKLPFLFCFAGYALHALEGTGGAGRLVSTALQATLLVACVALTAATFWPG